MKNLLFIAACLLFSFLELPANNSPKKITLDVIKNEKAVILNLSGLNTHIEFFTITDASGELVFIKRVNKQESKMKFNLEKLPQGEYTLKVEGDNFIELFETVISNESLDIENKVSHFKPQLVRMDQKIMINAYFPSEGDIQVAIYDTKGVLVYDFNRHKTGSFRKIFNLGQLEKGDYDVVVSTDYFNQTSQISI